MKAVFLFVFFFLNFLYCFKTKLENIPLKGTRLTLPNGNPLQNPKALQGNKKTGQSARITNPLDNQWRKMAGPFLGESDFRLCVVDI